MYYRRKYLQFNDLVFDNVDMLSEYEYGQAGTKYYSTALSYGNGSYVPLKDRWMFFEEYPVSMTLNLSLKKIPCDFRRFYRSFVITELSKGGKLWAIQNNELVWAYAICTGYSESVDEYRDKLVVDVDFLVYEGVWHKAHKQKTFLIPFDICRFLDCLNYQDYQPCKDSLLNWDCIDECTHRPHEYPICECDTNLPPEGEFCEICTCDIVTKEDALCYNLDKLQDFFKKCDGSMKIVYSCDKAIEWFTSITNKKLGRRYCTPCNQVDASVYVDTDIPTKNYELVLHGCMHNPFVEVNGMKIEVLGDYDGYLTFFGTGDVYYSTDDECCGEWVDLDQIIIKPYVDEETGREFYWNEELGFTFYPRYNYIVVDFGMCPSGPDTQPTDAVHSAGVQCIYVQVDSLTI